MMGDNASEEHQRSFAAPLIFIIVLAFQFASYWIDHLKKVVIFNSQVILKILIVCMYVMCVWLFEFIPYSCYLTPLILDNYGVWVLIFLIP